MAIERAPQQPSPLLAPGTQVCDWRVVEHHSQGGYGAVYRALRIAQEDAGPVALKLSLYPWGARFAREVALLSRLRHPSVPPSWDMASGDIPQERSIPTSSSSWVEGTPLYTWAEQQTLSSAQLFRLLAQVAHALAALHATHSSHRDVKGDNILVRRRRVPLRAR